MLRCCNKPNYHPERLSKVTLKGGAFPVTGSISNMNTLTLDLQHIHIARYRPVPGQQAGKVNMAQITELSKIQVPLGGQQIELQQIDHAQDGMSMLRVRIREGKRFTIFDIDRATAEQWAAAMQQWAKTQESK